MLGVPFPSPYLVGKWVLAPGHTKQRNHLLHINEAFCDYTLFIKMLPIS